MDSLAYKTENFTIEMLSSKWFWGATAIFTTIVITLTNLRKRKRKCGKE